MAPKLWFAPERRGVLNYKYKSLEKSSRNELLFFFKRRQAREISVRITFHQYIPSNFTFKTRPRNKTNRIKKQFDPVVIPNFRKGFLGFPSLVPALTCLHTAAHCPPHPPTSLPALPFHVCSLLWAWITSLIPFLFPTRLSELREFLLTLLSTPSVSLHSPSVGIITYLSPN